MAPNPEKQSSVTVATLCNDIHNIQETFEMQVAGELLTSGPNSSFYKTLVEPNIGAGYSPMTGYDNSTRDAVFGVGLSAVKESDFDRVVEIYHSTLKKVNTEFIIWMITEKLSHLAYKMNLIIIYIVRQFGGLTPKYP